MSIKREAVRVIKGIIQRFPVLIPGIIEMPGIIDSRIHQNTDQIGIQREDILKGAAQKLILRIAQGTVLIEGT